jgi:SAM-dependent methyltransferase
MALKQHSDLNEMVRQQTENSHHYVLPFIEQSMPVNAQTKVLEIGCGEGGVLIPFFKKGATCVGVDLDSPRIVNANNMHSNAIATSKLTFAIENVYEEPFKSKYQNYFDIIILKDVIEHIPNQEVFIPYLKTLLTDKGKVFFGFPPWYMPFGGHQQIAQSKWASKLPYYHILPNFFYLNVLKLAGETPAKIAELEEIKSTQITIERFENIVNKSGFNIIQKQWFLINPIYKYKFGLNPRKQNWLFGAIPFVRNFLTTCAYYTIEKN